MPKLSILGTGWGVRVQAPAFRAAGWTLHAIWGRSPEKVASARLEHGFNHAPANWKDAMIGADLVSIVTPPMEHLEQTRAALDMHINVLCEKPTALSADEAKQMLEAAERSRAWALVDHELRFVPARRHMRELFMGGFIGELRSVEARVAGESRADPSRPWNWWSSRALGGGILGAVGSHVLDGLRFVTDRDVRIVAARLETAIKQRKDETGAMMPVDSDDYAALMIDLQGAPGTIVLNAAARQALTDVLILRGSEGTLILRGGIKLEGARGNERVLQDITPAIPDDVPLAMRTDPWKMGTYLIAKALRGVIESGGKPSDGATLEDGLRAQELLDETRKLAGWQ
jgi:predicted dehydrogenase